MEQVFLLAVGVALRLMKPFIRNNWLRSPMVSCFPIYRIPECSCAPQTDLAIPCFGSGMFTLPATHGTPQSTVMALFQAPILAPRSEERRVGKEGRSRWS